MVSYAIINENTVLQIFESDGDISEMFAPGFATFVELSDAQVGVVQERWTYDPATGVLAAPIVPTPTATEMLAANTATQSTLTAQASSAMTPLLLSLQLGDATAEETAAAKLWQAYYRDVQAIDLTLASPAWPAQPA